MSRRADVFRAIGDPTRRNIIQLLATQQGMTINAITNNFQGTRQGVTKHIKMLEEAGVIEIHPHGRERLCHLRPEALKQVHDWSKSYEQFWAEKLNALELYLDRDEEMD